MRVASPQPIILFSMENEPSLSLWPPELNSEGRRQRSRQASCDEESEMRIGEKVHDSGRASPPGFWVEDPSLSASKLAAASLQSNFEDDTAWNDDDGGGGGGGDDDDDDEFLESCVHDILLSVAFTTLSISISVAIAGRSLSLSSMGIDGAV